MKNVHKIEIKVEGKDWEKCLDDSFKNKKKDLKVDGFRKGAIPKDVYIKKFGLESLYMDAVDAALDSAYANVIKDSKLIPVAQPSVDVKDINENCAVIEFTVITKPEVKLGKYTGLKVKKDKVEVSAKEIEEEIARVTSKFAEIVIKDSGKAEEGNTAVIDFEGTVDGKILDGATGENYPLELGSHTFIPGFEEGVVGMEVGDVKELKLTFPENYTEELANKDVLFKVTLREIKERVLPEMGKELYEDLGYNNVETEEDFKKEIEKTVIAKKESEIENDYLDKVIEEATENMTVEINQEIISDEVHRMIHQFEEQLQMQGLNMEQYFQFTGLDHDKMHEQMEPEATKRIKSRYLLEGIAEIEDFQITEEEAKKAATQMAEEYGMEEEQLMEMIGGMDALKYDCKMRKSLELLKEGK